MIGAQQTAPIDEFIDDVPTLPENQDVHEQTSAIIYSYVNVKAYLAKQMAKYYSSDPPFGDEGMKLFRSDAGAHLSRDFLQLVLRQLNEATNEIKDWNKPLASFKL